MSAKVSAFDFEALFIDYPETEFVLSEASKRGFNVPGSAEQHYNNGVTASIVYWGGTTVQAATYLARPDVAFTTASTNYKEVIGIQKWISPKLSPPSAANAPAGQSVPVGLAIPVLLIYPINEQTLNWAKRSESATTIGGDLVTTKIFWDVN